MAVSTDILRSFRAPRRVVRGLLGDRREARILVYLMAACALIFIAQWPRLAREAHLSDAVPLDALMSGALFAWLFVAPLAFYALGGVLTLVLKLVRGQVEPFAVRLALFWALLVASIPALLYGLVVGFIGPGIEATLTGGLVIVTFVGILVAGLRVALEAPRADA
ncbi:MAG: YIP1 family protein [Rhodobacter sp.]|nr:YIP1 family protein [Paracoccaceae bacterium]MCB1408763.1 YIP1 family protein [Paracoccaceae bacterium]MCC0080788.1 YIP1 family protein [Rhodobacter sp.]